jgi:hypothetical protein
MWPAYRSSVVLAMAFGVYEAEVGSLVCAAVAPVDEVMLVQRLPRGLQPPDPRLRAVWLVLGSGEQRLIALGAQPLLPGRQDETPRIHRRWRLLAAAVMPVAGKGRIVGRRSVAEQLPRLGVGGQRRTVCDAPSVGWSRRVRVTAGAVRSASQVRPGR